jgi:hypothetical protein
VLSKLARYDILIWIDADVRLMPDALSRMVGFIAQTGENRRVFSPSPAPPGEVRSEGVFPSVKADPHPSPFPEYREREQDFAPLGLISGVPRQVTVTLFEQLIIPLIHFVLLGYLPISRMRQSESPAYSAGCGQLFMARRAAYEKAGGHAAIRASLHDGITLPRAFRHAGIATDLFDATDIAECRMYRSARQVFNGFAKNATEAMATVIALPVWTVLLLGHCLPWVVVPLLVVHPQFVPSLTMRMIWYSALLISLIATAKLAVRFRQTFPSWLLHPIGIILLLAIQYYALVRALAGLKTSWKSRGYTPVSMSQ